jgi:peptide chain release factor 3
LAEEGLLQVFMPTHGMRFPIVAVIGVLQLDVIEARMEAEYGIPCKAERSSHVAARWPVVPRGQSLVLPTSGVLEAVDRLERPVLIFESDWVLRYTLEKNPGVTFLASL